MKTEELNLEVIDIETYRAMFLYCGYNPVTKEKFQFEISHRKNQIDGLVKHLLEYNRDFLVTFNGVYFDTQVLQFIVDNCSLWIHWPVERIIRAIFEFAQKTIDDRNYELQPHYKEHYLDFKQIDLFLLFHYNNDAKRCSLKWAGEFSLDGNIEELPIDFRKEELTSEEIDEIIEYCWNDITATTNLYNIAVGDTNHPDYAGKNKVQLRLDLIEEYKFPSLAINWNDVKIGAELNKKVYMDLAKINEAQLYSKVKERKTKTGFRFKDCFPDYTHFDTAEFTDFFTNLGKTKVNLNEKQEFPFILTDITIMFAKGGVHSADNPRIIDIPKGYLLIDADVGSQYPNNIRKRNIYPAHLGPKWNEAYVLNIPKRLEAKRLYKETGDKKYDNFQECFKLVMNGNFGRLGDRFDWQYDPFASMQVTIGGQVDLFMLAEDLLQIPTLKITSMNTDGITVLIHQDYVQKYYDVCKTWEEEVGNDILGNLEYVEYELFVQTSVNDYLAVKKADWVFKDGEFKAIVINKPLDKRVKKKGDFLTSYELHKNKSKCIVPIALEKYFTQGIPVEDTVISHRNIFDFCIAKKASRDYFYRSVDRKTGTVTDLNKLVRYYCSKGIGEKLYKMKSPNSDKTGPEKSNCESDSELQVLYNKPFSAENWDDYGIDYTYYIRATNKIIDKISPIYQRDRKEKESGQISLF
jgi:hypothetical protein